MKKQIINGILYWVSRLLMLPIILLSAGMIFFGLFIISSYEAALLLFVIILAFLLIKWIVWRREASGKESI